MGTEVAVKAFHGEGRPCAKSLRWEKAWHAQALVRQPLRVQMKCIKKKATQNPYSASIYIHFKMSSI